MRLTSVMLIVLSGAVGPSILAQDGIVSLDHVTNLSSTGYLMAGNTHQVSIRYDFRDLPDDDWWKTWNAFEVYSPDGADWGYLQGNTGPLIATVDDRGTLCMFLKHYYFDGSDWTQTGDIGDPAPGSGGPETRAGTYIQVGCFTMGVGFIGGFDNGIALLFEFETSLTDVGRTICIDTNSAITSWDWAKGSSSDFPRWDNGLGVDGPRCWEICATPNMGPEWCSPEGAVTFGYCTGGSYHLCAISNFLCPPGPVDYYFLVPPYDNGDYGSVDPSSGLWTWSGPTLQPGAYEIEFQVYDHGGYAAYPFTLHVLVTDCDCCVSRVGDANCSGDDEPTIGDIAYMIDRLFILPVDPGWCCLEEADVNQSGGSYPYADDITIGDISTLIDYLFITGPELGLPDCL